MRKYIIFLIYTLQSNTNTPKKEKMTIWLKYYTKEKEVDFIVVGGRANSGLYINDPEYITREHNAQMITSRIELLQILNRKPRIFRIDKETYRLIPSDNYERTSLYDR